MEDKNKRGMSDKGKRKKRGGLRAETMRVKRKALIENLANGATITQACKYVSINRNTYYRWFEGDTKFREAIETAKLVRIKMVEDALYVSALKGNVTAQMFFLANRRPEEWRDIRKMEHTFEVIPLPQIFEKMYGKERAIEDKSSKALPDKRKVLEDKSKDGT